METPTDMLQINPEDLENPSGQELNNIISLAQAGSPEDWAEIDKKMSELCNGEEFLDWARVNLFNEDSGLCDLSATILEASDTDLTSEDVGNLMRLMATDDSYPGFRASCALAKRLDNENIRPAIDQIKQKLQSFLSDPDVSDIAERYLSAIGE